MKLMSLVLLMTFATASYASASAICASNVLGTGQVKMYNSPLMELSEFKSQVAKNGLYKCQVTSTMPVFFNVQTTLVCTQASGEVLTGVTLEGLNVMGQHTATLSLYKNANKIFMSGCVQEN